MNPFALLFIFLGYFGLLLGISYFVGKNGSSRSFYTGDRKSPWFVVAFGMVGATLSGVTFISVPGEVGNSSFHYFQFVLGNFAGYVIIATLLLPYYYRKNIISIYTVLYDKMGNEGYLTTSGFFIVSKIIGAAFRLYLAALVIHLAVSRPLGISFEVTVLFCLLLIWLYTYKSGIKTVVWSDMLQTSILLIAVIATIAAIRNKLDIPIDKLASTLIESPNSRIFNFDWQSPNYFFKQFISGIFITIALNGFDQDIVQKNLTCSSGNKARKNMLVFSFMFMAAIFLFLILGASIYLFAETHGISIPNKTDQLLPAIALNNLGIFVAALFILGISAAAFSSADSATTALTTAFCIDFLSIEKKTTKQQNRIRLLVHLGFNLIIFIAIVLFYKLNNESVVISIFKAAGYTYGPILAVFTFSFFSKRKPMHKLILPICLASPVLTYLFTLALKNVFKNYNAGFELIIINACIALFLLSLFSKKTKLLKKINK
jgi:Na+/proline symporter